MAYFLEKKLLCFKMYQKADLDSASTTMRTSAYSTQLNEAASKKRKKKFII